MTKETTHSEKLSRFARANRALADFLLAVDAPGQGEIVETGVGEEEKEKAPKFFYGGQAVMEGVMMRSAYTAAIAVRSPKYIAIGGYDPVAYFNQDDTQGEAVQGREEFEHEWNRAVWRFASEENMQLFAEEPEKYAPQYGGYCALAASDGEAHPADPQIWAVRDGKLYLFGNQDARETWTQSAPAGADWPPEDMPAVSAEGEIVVHEEPLNPKIYRGRLAKIPLLRGLIMLWDSLGLGSRALMWSADVALGEEEDVSFSGPLGIGTMLVALAFGIGLFLLLPAAAAGGVERVVSIDSALLTNFVEGFIRLSLVIGYMWLVGRWGEIKRVFSYHGAEHKTINGYEAGSPLTPEAIGRFPVEHPRCGTGFLLVVVVVSIFVFAFLGHPDNLLLRLGSRILLIPLVAGIAYEWIRFSASHMENALIRALIRPNLLLQRLTTNEPTPDMLEVSITALERVLVGAFDAQPE